MNLRKVVAALGLLGVLALCRPVSGLDLELNLNPADFTRTRIYSVTASGTVYTEAVNFTTAAGSISPGVPVDIRVNLSSPILMENYFPGTPFGVLTMLTKGAPPPTFIHSFSSDLSINMENLAIAGTQHEGWTSVPNTLRQSTVAFVSPTAGFGRVNGLRWRYTAPSWTPAGSAVQLLLSFQIVHGSSSPFADPGRNLVTFVPEPSSCAFVLSFLSTMVLPRRVRRPGSVGALLRPGRRSSYRTGRIRRSGLRLRRNACGRRSP